MERGTIVPLFVMVMRYDDEFGKGFFSLFFFSSFLFSFFLLLLQGRESSLVGLLTWLLGESKKERKERGDEWLLTGTRRRSRRCAMDE